MKHIHGILGSIIFLIAAITLLLLLGFTTQLPLPQEEGILIDFESISSSSSSSSSATDATKENSSASDENIENQKLEESAFVASGDQQTTNPNTERINKMLDNAFNNGFTNIGDHNNENPSNLLGDINNGPDAGFGTLEGSRGVIKVDPVAKDNSYGTVKFKITVNETGKVTDITLISTTCDECIQPAKDAIEKWKYEPKPGSGYQIGTVIIEFKQR